LNRSIQKRLLITTTVVLGLFLTLTGWVLERSYYRSVVAGAEEQLRLVIYSLMGAAQEQGGALAFSQGVAEPRLNQPDSGLYARVGDELGTVIWTSPSAVTTGVNFPSLQGPPGAFSFSSTERPTPRFHLSYTVFWEDLDIEQVIFSVATDRQPFQAAINGFRRSLGLGLGAATVFFVLAQLLALRWGLRPLRIMAQEVHELEAGQRQQLSAAYPTELRGLAENLDRFVTHEQRSRSRYRNALDDLAHSLKTPLAVIRNGLLERPVDLGLVREQLDGMEMTVTRQLSKAAASGPAVVAQTVNVAQIARRLLRALETAYAQREINVTSVLDEQVMIRADERDVMEIVGNLLENAFKYAHSAVRISVAVGAPEGAQSVVHIEDDGPGIPADLRKEAQRRGRRLDQIQAGQGIGLAVVAELVALYEGELSISDSELGGAHITVRLG